MAESNLEKSIRDACETLEDVFKAQHDDNRIKNIWVMPVSPSTMLHSGYSGLPGSNPRPARIRNVILETISNLMLMSGLGSNGKRELRSTARRDRRCPFRINRPRAPGRIYLTMLHCSRPFDAEHTDHHILSLKAFLKPEPEKKTDPATALCAQ